MSASRVSFAQPVTEVGRPVHRLDQRTRQPSNGLGTVGLRRSSGWFGAVRIVTVLRPRRGRLVCRVEELLPEPGHGPGQRVQLQVDGVQLPLQARLKHGDLLRALERGVRPPRFDPGAGRGCRGRLCRDPYRGGLGRRECRLRPARREGLRPLHQQRNVGLGPGAHLQLLQQFRQRRGGRRHERAHGLGGLERLAGDPIQQPLDPARVLTDEPRAGDPAGVAESVKGALQGEAGFGVGGIGPPGGQVAVDLRHLFSGLLDKELDERGVRKRRIEDHDRRRRQRGGPRLGPRDGRPGRGFRNVMHQMVDQLDGR